MKESLKERLNEILPKLISEQFLSGKSLGNDVPFHIFDYAADEELEVRKHIAMLMDHLPKHRPGLRVKHLDLFDFMLDHLKSRNLLDKAIQMQREKGDAALKKALVGTLAESKMGPLVAQVAQPNDHDLILISGAGSVWPLLRVHSLLNNFHAVFDNKPAVIFYPVSYDGQSLRLFGKLAENNYYRAFKLIP